MNIAIPKLSLVVLIGPSGSGKSTFARKHFLPTEVLSSDACRALVSDDETNQAVTHDAFEVLHLIAAKRLAVAGSTVTIGEEEADVPVWKITRLERVSLTGQIPNDSMRRHMNVTGIGSYYRDQDRMDDISDGYITAYIHAIADQGGDALLRQGLATQERQHAVGRDGQVRCRVDERAVEIERNCLDAFHESQHHPHSAAASCNDGT